MLFASTLLACIAPRISRICCSSHLLLLHLLLLASISSLSVWSCDGFEVSRLGLNHWLVGWALIERLVVGWALIALANTRLTVNTLSTLAYNT